MAYTINSGSTPTIANFQADLSELVEILKRGAYPAQTLTPGTIDALAGLANTTNGSTTIQLS